VPLPSKPLGALTNIACGGPQNLTLLQCPSFTSLSQALSKYSWEAGAVEGVRHG
jgi:hypothetical protein